MKMIVRFLILGCLVGGGFLESAFSAQDERGLTIGGAQTITDKHGKEILLYQESHALVIGVSNYTDWPKLPGVKKDVEEVKTLLESQGFHVVVHLDVGRNALEQAFNTFIAQYGHHPENRLVFYFAGHGHTLQLAYGGEMGYIVPADAALPHDDESGFLNKAMDMQQIEVYARRIQAKHALFIFDSCFSGSIFAISRDIPEHITHKTANPVRQFITSGSANETVPDESIFRQQLIAALEGEGDTNNDGYVTGTELGMFLEDTVINYSKDAQHPQYGKIRDAHLDKGDVVFEVPGAVHIEHVITTSPAPSSSVDPEAEMWELVQESTNIEDIQAFLDAFPQGRLTKVAQFRLEQLERQLMTPAPIEPASVERMAYPLPEKPSIAVLPLTNMSDDTDQEYFADGITEDLITDLSKVSGLFVIARHSTFMYKGKAVKIREIAEDLGVRYILEGSVRQSGDRMRITVQCIDALTGGHLWAERYDRERQDIFAVSDDVVQRVVSELAVTLKVSEQERLFRRHTENLEAYETFLQARRVLTATKEATLEVKKLYERVIDLDPHFAGGYAGLSFVISRMVRHGFSASPKEDMERTFTLAQQAVATDDTFGWSYVALGSAYSLKGEHDKAIATIEEGIRIQPNFADAYRYRGFFLHWAGRGDEAIDSVKKSIRLDPAYERLILGMTYFTAGRYEDAIATINQNYADLARKGHLILYFLAASYAAIGQDEKAREVMKVCLEKHPTTTLSSYSHLPLYKKPEDRERYANLLRRAGMPEK